MDQQEYLTGIGELYAAEVLGEGLANRWMELTTDPIQKYKLGLFLQLQDFPLLDPPDFLGMGPPDFLGMDPPNFLGMGPPAGAAFRARWRAFLHAAAASGAERRCQEAMHFRG
jgi:hypothetical protein